MILERFKVPAKDQVLVSEAALRATVTQIFQKLGIGQTPDTNRRVLAVLAFLRSDVAAG